MPKGKSDNWGGAGRGQGRKPRAEEERLIALGTNAIQKKWESEQAFWDHVADRAEKSDKLLELLIAYVYGKPKERKEIDLGDNQINISPIQFVEAEVIEEDEP